MAAPAIWTPGSLAFGVCVAELLSSVEAPRPQPESKATAGKISSPCFEIFLPRYDIFFTNLLTIPGNHTATLFDWMRPGSGLSGEIRQKIGVYGGIHAVIERYTFRDGTSRFIILFYIIFYGNKMMAARNVAGRCAGGCLQF
ncbi:hypothetical protein [Marinobacter sp. SS8-8]|uniref:hypothetical protein n=1 Tax=Marinobacter sp. SS8-8 TaxID=3050452 RepID=UPI0026E0AA15|nr:hypothetical protein [Marinobacter sp. SS8-8]